MNGSCVTFDNVLRIIVIRNDEWVMSHMTESCLMSHMWISHVTHMNESCLTYEWVMSQLWMSHVSCMNESCLTYEWVMSHIWMSHVSHDWVMSHMTCLMLSYVTHDPFMCVTWLIHICDMTHSYVRHDSVSRYHTWHTTHSCVWHVIITYANDDVRMSHVSHDDVRMRCVHECLSFIIIHAQTS